MLLRILRTLTDRGNSQLSTMQTIWWWEKRRPIYNLMVFIAGVLSIAGAIAGSLVTNSECGIPDPPLFACFAIVAYGVAANALYTAGWVTELLLRKNLKDQNEYAKKAFVAGLAFSVALTLVPGVLVPTLCILTGGGDPSYEEAHLTKRCTGHEPLVGASLSRYYSEAVRAGER